MKMPDVATELEAALAAAEEPTEVEDSSPETEVVEKTEPKKIGKGAQDRIRELVSKTKGIEEELNKYKNLAGEKDQELKKLVDLLQARENDAKVVKKIQELYASGDETWKDTIEKLDKVIRGEEVEEEPTGDPKKDDALKKAKDLIKNTREELDDAIADQRADLLLHKANLLIERYMDELPEQYGEHDRRRLRDVLSDHIDWDAIEQKPDVLANKVAEGIQSAVNWYGDPQGSVKVPNKNSNDQVVPLESPKDRLDKIMKMDFGKLKTVKTPKGDRMTPEISDDAFEKELANALRYSNR